MAEQPISSTPFDDLHQHKDTPEETLALALAHCQMDDPFAEVLIIYNTKSGKSGSYDSGLTLAESGFLCDLFKHWLINGALGALMGAKADVIEKAVTGEEEP